jgi:hypothetical protein
MLILLLGAFLPKTEAGTIVGKPKAAVAKVVVFIKFLLFMIRRLMGYWVIELNVSA